MPANRNRKAGPIRRTIVTPRTADPRLFAAAPVTVSRGPVRRNRSTLKGQAGEWSQSTAYRDPIANDARWDLTVSDHPTRSVATRCNEEQ
jgi:hypothetical protein